MVIICLVGVSILSASLNNLQNQQASIERMQDQYEAEGRIERVVAVLLNKGCVNETIIISACELAEMPMTQDEITFLSNVDSDVSDDDNDTITFTLKTKTETVEVVCKIEFNGIISKNDLNADTNPDSYNISKANLVYSSYEINVIAEEVQNGK